MSDNTRKNYISAKFQIISVFSHAVGEARVYTLASYWNRGIIII